ncbi:MAG: hypothetical protein ACHQ0J_01220 [Candidatus Dormibacterales bacterium]
MADLEIQLAALAPDIDWPATPQLSHRVLERITRQPQRWYLTRWAVAAAVAVAAAGALLAYGPSRDVIAGWLNLHTLIERVHQPPTPSPLPSGVLGAGLGLGSPTTLAGAQSQVSWKVSVSTALGQPDAVYVQLPPEGPAQGEVTLVYSARAGIPVSSYSGVAALITEARGTVDQNFFGKMLGPGTTLEQVTVAGAQGYWIAGQPSVFFFIDAEGNFRSETVRLATNTLILDDHGTIFRIEGDMTKAQALAIAASLG